MKIVEPEQAKSGEPDCDYLEDLCFIEVRAGSKPARCLVAASIYMPWYPLTSGQKRPSHAKKYRNGWGAGYNTRTAFIDAFVILRSKLDLWTTSDDVELWYRGLEVDADFQIETHMRSLRGTNSDNMKYTENGWVEVNDFGAVRATMKGLKAYEAKYRANHGVEITCI